MLDEAEYFIMNFIKGPVCRGQLAVDVIEDRFWVFFIDPKVGGERWNAELLARESSNLRLPAEWGSDALALLPWLEFADLETNYLRAKSECSSATQARKDDLSLIWDGDGRNPNAALTVFRHFDSASVVKGLVGEPPKTAWVIGYPLFERIYYLLVAGYDVYGNAGHQLNSRLYMDFLRMEGEFNFLVFLPEGARRRRANTGIAARRHDVNDYVYGRDAHFNRPRPASSIAPAIRSASCTKCCSARVAPVAAKRFELSSVADPALRRDLQALSNVRGASLAWMPEVVFLRVEQPPRRAAVLQCAAQYRAQERCAPVHGGTAAGGEHADGGAGLPRRLSERDFQRQGSGPARARECNRRAGVGRRLPQARRSLRRSPHQPALLGYER